MTKVLRMARREPLTFESAPDVLTVEEFVCLARIGRNAGYELVASGLIPHAKIGRSLRILKTAAVAFLEGRATEGSETG
jgi:hypothetical protein